MEFNHIKNWIRDYIGDLKLPDLKIRNDELNKRFEVEFSVDLIGWDINSNGDEGIKQHVRSSINAFIQLMNLDYYEVAFVLSKTWKYDWQKEVMIVNGFMVDFSKRKDPEFKDLEVY